MNYLHFTLEKLSKDQKLYDEMTRKMSDAFYLSQKRIDKERRSSKIKGRLIAGSGVVGLSGVGYGAYKTGLGSKKLKQLIEKGRGKLHSAAEKVGREAGVTAGKATTSAADAYTKLLGKSMSEITGKVRGGNFLQRVLKKVIFK